ncbi:foldase protein PrsA [Metabacillus crassostreae]|uniref:peptidylprolyl isomerase n=1 Tax=Metabacillus crassostreae TaxID=929098 RepID=UPI00195D434C|nr:peptidylprolyl isomerase [Metabacillus crassostreae]MBM7605491.1 foldase protein PrsA [Metabacillus crassostreae]
MIEKIFSSKKTVAVLAVLLIVVVAAFVFLSTRSEVVAKIGSESLTKDDLYTFFVEQNGEAAIDSLITKNIIEQEVKKEKVSVSQEEVDTEIEAVIASYGGEETFNQTLATSGLTMEDVEGDIKTNLQIEALLKSRIEITDEELQTYFDENKDSFAKTKQVKASHILVEDEETAKEVKEKLDGGEDFAELAKEYSTDTGSAEAGGDVGFFGAGSMVAEFEEAAFAMKVDELSEPVKSEYGYHLIKVTDIQEAEEATLENSKEEIKGILFDEKLTTEYPTWLEEKKEEYKVKNYLAAE